ncbi:MAG: serine/threonine protein kinase [Verrucomicrobia bacterium]|nr:serine/threonine protein kinase [Verrucomicrobiota bacterium]MBU4247964.1 serine/threonine protein kinase [Verrucomicrobiota bacterium]MBU4291461.1 serine/threonine protein kinase [Verrucomicrobiota bacterium]MBU4496433.1 serine/threonine protein kinase [Verrucomicrobiota bacterium]MCG2679635.1 serine/threonine protein kinase [Kiritimatiellia bacterium]
MNHTQTPGNPDQPPEIKGYQLLEQLSGGELLPCWRAVQQATGREVLIRLLPSALTPAPDTLERMRATADRIIALDARSIVRVYDFGVCVTNRRYFMATELFSRHSILEWTRDDEYLSETNALLVAKCAAEALAYAWDKAHIIHANIKPEKFLVNADNIVKLDEIGLAKILAAGWEDSSRGVITGTPRYMSPKRLIKKRAPGIPDDIYALGLTLYQLVTGIVPVLYNADRDEWQIPPELNNPRDVNPELSKGMGNLIQKMMEVKTDRRHQSWKELLKDIASVADNMILLSDPDVTQPIMLEMNFSLETVRIAMRRAKLKIKANTVTSDAAAHKPNPKNTISSRQRSKAILRPRHS